MQELNTMLQNYEYGLLSESGTWLIDIGEEIPPSIDVGRKILQLFGLKNTSKNQHFLKSIVLNNGTKTFEKIEDELQNWAASELLTAPLTNQQILDLYKNKELEVEDVLILMDVEEKEYPKFILEMVFLQNHTSQNIVIQELETYKNMDRDLQRLITMRFHCIKVVKYIYNLSGLKFFNQFLQHEQLDQNEVRSNEIIIEEALQKTEQYPQLLVAETCIVYEIMLFKTNNVCVYFLAYWGNEWRLLSACMKMSSLDDWFTQCDAPDEFIKLIKAQSNRTNNYEHKSVKFDLVKEFNYILFCSNPVGLSRLGDEEDEIDEDEPISATAYIYLEILKR